MSSPSLLVDPDLFLFPVRIGDVIGGKYQLTRLIASGGMGVVFEGTHLLLETRVAIKVVRPEVATKEGLDRFIQEGRVAARLRSPHVARVLDTGRLESGIPYLVMEYLEGEDLYETLRRRGPLGIKQVVDYVLQICEGLAEAHAIGLVHRDLKPENLFVTRAHDGEEIVKILDFGITKAPSRVGERSHTEPGSGMGSPHYMAPEQMCAPHAVDVRADLWTLGVVMYELLAGRPPFDAETVPAVCALVLGENQAPLGSLRPDLPAGLERAIQRCLEKDPRARHPDVFELARDIAAFGPPGSELRLERIRRISGLEFPTLELERVSDVPVQLTRRRKSVPPKASHKILSIAGVALASVAFLGFAGKKAVIGLVPHATALAPAAAVDNRPLAAPVFAPAALALQTRTAALQSVPERAAVVAEPVVKKTARRKARGPVRREAARPDEPTVEPTSATPNDNPY